MRFIYSLPHWCNLSGYLFGRRLWNLVRQAVNKYWNRDLKIFFSSRHKFLKASWIRAKLRSNPNFEEQALPFGLREKGIRLALISLIKSKFYSRRTKSLLIGWYSRKFGQQRERKSILTLFPKTQGFNNGMQCFLVSGLMHICGQTEQATLMKPLVGAMSAIFVLGIWASFISPAIFNSSISSLISADLGFCRLES